MNLILVHRKTNKKEKKRNRGNEENVLNIRVFLYFCIFHSYIAFQMIKDTYRKHYTSWCYISH